MANTRADSCKRSVLRGTLKKILFTTLRNIPQKIKPGGYKKLFFFQDVALERGSAGSRRVYRGTVYRTPTAFVKVYLTPFKQGSSPSSSREGKCLNCCIRFLIFKLFFRLANDLLTVAMISATL